MKTVKMRALTAAILAGSAAAPGIAFASTAANTTITNTVTVNFDNAAGIAQTAIDDSVSFTVDLVPAALTVTTTAADVDPASEDTNVDLVYTVTGNANGPDTYDVSINAGSSSTNMEADATLTAPVSVDLGGTTVAVAAFATDTTIEVPYDGDADTDTGTINGLIVGSTIVIDPTGTAELVTITGIDQTNAGTTNRVTLTIDSDDVTPGNQGLANAHAAALIIGEQADVTVGVTTDFITAGASGTHDVIVTYTAQGTGNPTADSGTTTITVRQPVLTVTKYVRNDTNPVVGAGALTVDGEIYYTSGVSGAPNDVMEYLIVVDNSDANAGDATDVTVSDPIPQFTSYESGTAALITNFDNSLGTWPTGATFGANLNDGGNDGDAAEFDTTGNGTIYVYAGVGGDDNGPLDTGTGTNGDGEGGALSADEITAVRFQVRID